MANAKRSEALEAALHDRDPSDEVQLAIAIECGPRPDSQDRSRVERLRLRQDNFHRDASAVIDAIEARGGTIDTVGWSNQTVYATLAAHVARLTIEALESFDQVRQVDLIGGADAEHELSR
jgi:hypothetical protein